MSSHATFDRIELEICRRGQVANVISRAKFLKIVPKYTTPENGLYDVHRPYNSVCTACLTVPHCDDVTHAHVHIMP